MKGFIVTVRFMASKSVGSLTLDTPLEDCELGVSKTITVEVTPTKNDDGGFTADVIGVENYEEPDEPSGEEEKAHTRGDKGMPGHVLTIGIGKA